MSLTRLEHSFGVREITVRVGDSQNSVTLDGFSAKSEEKPPEGFVSAECLGSEWHKERGNPTVQTCEDISRIIGQNSASSVLNIASYINSNRSCFLRNSANSSIPQGTKFEATITVKKRSGSSESLSSIKKIIELPLVLVPGASLELIDMPSLTSADIIGVRLSIIAISNQFSENDITNNCTAIGSMECP